MKILGVAVLVILGTWVAFILAQKTITPTEAENIASERIERSGQQLGFDPQVFKGPKRIIVGGATYGFLWQYSDQKGAIELIVTVNQNGGTEFSFDGDLDRLRESKKSRH